MVQPVWAVIFLEPQPYMNDSFIISSEIFLDHRATTSWHHGSSRDSYIAHTHRILPRYTHGISRNYWSEYVASCGRKNNTITVTRWRNSYKNRANQDRKELANYEFRQYINWFEPRCPINATIPRSSKACWKILRFQIFSLFSLWTVMWTMDFEGFPARNLHFRWIKQKKTSICPFENRPFLVNLPWCPINISISPPFSPRFTLDSPRLLNGNDHGTTAGLRRLRRLALSPWKWRSWRSRWRRIDKGAADSEWGICIYVFIYIYIYEWYNNSIV